MIIHIIQKDNTEVGLISYCEAHNLDFMDCCIRFCSGESFENILNLPTNRLKLIYLGKEEIENE